MGCLWSKPRGKGGKYASQEEKAFVAAVSPDDVKVEGAAALPLEPRGYAAADFFGSWVQVAEVSGDPAHDLLLGITTIDRKQKGEWERKNSYSKEASMALKKVDVVVTNSQQDWGPAQGSIVAGILKLTLPEAAKTGVLEGTLHDDLLHMSGGVVLRRVMDDFSGTWATRAVWLGDPSSNLLLGTNSITQRENGNVIMENGDQPWSPATGYVRGSTMTLEAPQEMKGLIATISGRQLSLSHGVTLYRTVPNFRGAWLVCSMWLGEPAGEMWLGTTAVEQTEDVVTFTNARQPWSPGAGTVSGHTVTFYAPSQLKGVKATLKGGQLHMSSGVALYQKSDSDKPTFTQGLPRSEVINIPLENQRLASVNQERRVKISAREYRLKSLNLGQDANPIRTANIFDINLHEGDAARQNVERYYSLCKDYVGLQVTTSCFSVWRKNKKTNGYAKVIPAVKSLGNRDDVRIFFFDDNLEWEGGEKSPGICNLRDVTTGEFVEFGEGKNGFKREFAARHTVIHSSTEYHNILVKANILDAMEDPEYFSSIIARYADPCERIIVYMDVNSTILCNDSVQGKDLGGTLLSTIFEFVELKPREPFELAFSGLAPVKIEKQKTLKTLVKDVTADDNKAYHDFWTEAICWRFFEELSSKGDLKWMGQGRIMTLEETKQMHKHYTVALEKAQTQDGLALSWFKVFDRLRERDTMVLNSFGVDTRKVILATVPDECRVLQVTVNHGMWEERDVKKFASQFND